MTMQCPNCQKEHEDFDGLGVLHCESCGYCRHASETDGKCDYCGKPKEIPPVPTQNRMRDEMNERIAESREQYMAWAKMAQGRLDALEMALSYKQQLLRQQSKYSRLLRFARRLQEFSESQTEYIKRGDT